MRKIVVIVILFISYQYLICQDKEPKQIKFLYKSDSVQINSEFDSFRQNGFVIGWHGSNRPNLDLH